MAFAREGLPPGFASTNEFALAVESMSNWTTVICRPHQPELVYYGLYGGELRAEYDVRARHTLSFMPPRAQIAHSSGLSRNLWCYSIRVADNGEHVCRRTV
jgi:hypothetical protein